MSILTPLLLTGIKTDALFTERYNIGNGIPMSSKKIKQNAFSMRFTNLIILHFYAKFYNRFKSLVHLSCIFVHLSKNLKIFDA